jgi:hypothetical protein
MWVRSMVNGRLDSSPVWPSLAPVGPDVAHVGGDVGPAARAGAERGALDRPAGVVVPVLESDVGPGRLGRRRDGRGLHPRHPPAGDDSGGAGRTGAAQPAGERSLHGRCRSVANREPHHRRRQAGVVGRQRHERRERLQRDSHRNVSPSVGDGADGVLAAERHVWEAGAVEGDGVAAVQVEREPLLDRRRHGPERVGVVGVLGHVQLVEDVPVPQRAVAAEVDLSGAQAADGHADVRQLVAAVDGWLAARGERGDPLRVEPLVDRDQVRQICWGGGRADRVGHGAAGRRHHRRRQGDADRLDRVPARWPAVAFGAGHLFACGGVSHVLWFSGKSRGARAGYLLSPRDADQIGPAYLDSARSRHRLFPPLAASQTTAVSDDIRHPAAALACEAASGKTGRRALRCYHARNPNHGAHACRCSCRA